MIIKIPRKLRIKLLNSVDVYKVMQHVLLHEQKIDQEKEHFWMIGLANNNRLLYVELVSLGSVVATTVEPMNVFRVAVLKGAVQAIMVHNHPSGGLVPSAADKDITDRLIQVGRILNIHVIEHMIISTRHLMSFAETGLLAELEQSVKWVPPYKLIEKIRKEEKKIRTQAVLVAEKKAKKEGKKEEKIEMAKNAIKEGLSTELIVKLTGLSKKEIEQL